MRRDQYYGDNSNGNDDNIDQTPLTSQTLHKNYKYCINCWRSVRDTEFYTKEEGYSWQYRQRCKLCERRYQQDFMERYPDTKRIHNLPFLDKEEQKFYEMMMKEEKDFSDE